MRMGRNIKCFGCKKLFYLQPHREKNKTHTCSYVCAAKLSSKRYSKKITKVCFICSSPVSLKPSRFKKLKFKKICCSKKCTNELRKQIYIGEKNPNRKYYIEDNFFNEIDTEFKAYLLGWIASDGSVKKDGIVISIHKKDIHVLEDINKNLPKQQIIRHRKKNIVSLSINGILHSKNICKHLSINPGKKSHTVNFPNHITEEMKKHFVRGFFDGDGSVKIIRGFKTPMCSISTSSILMRKALREWSKAQCSKENGNINITWSGTNCIDFLSSLYDNSNFYLKRKRDLYHDICLWKPTINFQRYKTIPTHRFVKTNKNAVYPFKVRASDSGYDLTLIEKIKTIEHIEYYDTGIKVQPLPGFYFDLVARSSLAKSGYMMSNCIGIIDQSYIGPIIVGLIKINKDLPDLILPQRYVQIIPRPIIHVEFKEVDDFEETSRGEGSFGSTGK